jgi:hypothetical protein
LFVLHKGAFKKIIPDLCLCIAMGAVLIFCVITGFTDFSPAEWAHTLASAKDTTVSFNGIFFLNIFKYFWGFTLAAPAGNIALLGTATLALLAIWRTPSNRFLILFILTPAVLLINQKASDYSYLPFLPFAIAVYLQNANTTNLNDKRGILGKARMMPLLLGGLYLIVLLTHFIVAISSPTGQVSLHEVINRFNSSAQGQDLKSGSVAIGYSSLQSPSLVVLGDAGTRVVSLEPSLTKPSRDNSIDDYEKMTGRKVKYFLYSQSYFDRHSAPPSSLFAGKHQFDLSEAGWAISPLDPLNRALSRMAYTPRYNYSVYKRRDS